MKNIFLVLVCAFLSSAVMASERSVYDFQWLDKDKEVYVLQNRKFRKAEKVYVGVNGVKTLSGAFVNSYGVSARAGYFLREDWGIEFAFGKNSGSENDTAKGVREQGTVPFYRKVNQYMGAMVVWSPFYSKINTFNQVFYFDWMFGAGAASIKTADNRNKFVAGADTNQLTEENNMGAIWNTGFRFYINDHWSLRVDFTGLHYKANKTTKTQSGPVSKSSNLFSNYDLGLGLNYTF